MKAVLMVFNRELGQDRTRKGPQHALLAGMRAIGHTIEVHTPLEPDRLVDDFDIGFIWNGGQRRGDADKIWKKARKPLLILERGFFDRYKHAQIDAEGFNHAASWVRLLGTPCPPDGAERLHRFCGKTAPVRRRGEGYALLLLQVPSDVQLRDSHEAHPGPLLDMVEDALPAGIELRVRAHPHFGWNCGTKRRGKMLDGSLDDALDGARIIITINSNAGNDALVRGCPIIAFGPSMYGMAGVAMATSRETLSDDLRQMLGGWEPAAAAVSNYLGWLASRQYSSPEIATGWPLKVAMLAAGVAPAEVG